MKRVIVISAFISLSLFFSCEEKGPFVDCRDCLKEDPSEATIEAMVNPFENSNFVTLIKLWEGNIEDSLLLGTFETYSKTWNHTVKLNKMYTITATYYYYGKFYTAFNSVSPGVRNVKNLCESPCYIIYGNKLDLRIKYY